MTTRYFALAAGVVYLFIGALGFVPNLVHPTPVTAPDVVVRSNYGYLFGLFPINFLHNLVHLGVGIWGIAAYRRLGSARTYARALAIFYGALTIMGFIPGLRTVFGLIPVYGHDIWLHAVTAAIAVYFSWSPTTTRSYTEHSGPV